MAKGQLATIHYESALRPQRSYFAHPNLGALYEQAVERKKKRSENVVVFCANGNFLITLLLSESSQLGKNKK